MSPTLRHFHDLCDILRHGTQKYPHRSALIFGQKKITYQEVSNHSLRLSRILLENGIKKRDRVAIFLDNSPDFVYAYFGILSCGAIVVPVNHMLKRDETAYILKDSESRILITSHAYEEMAKELSCMLQTLEKVLFIQSQGTKNKPEAPDSSFQNDKKRSELSREDLAIFLYTSGTTGHPKAAMLTHGNLLSNIESSSQAIRITKKDTVVCFLPLFHSFAATVCMLMPLANGASCLLLKSAKPIKKLIRSIRIHRATILVGIPSIYAILKDLRFPWYMKKIFLRVLNPVRVAISGAAALPICVLSEFENKFGIPLLEGYGLTEASPVVTLNPLNKKRLPGSIGVAIPNVSLKVIDSSGEKVNAGQIGELCVKGPNIMRGYFKKEHETLETIKNNWLLTGDMAKIDKDGYATIMGRKKEMVNVRGLNVYPREIEEVLYQNPAIKEAAVIGTFDPHKGEVPKAFVVLKEGHQISDHDIAHYLKERLASYKIPKQIVLRATLPKNASGKILKRLLQNEELLQQQKESL